MSILALWQPIVLSAVLVFFVSAIVWMAMPWHKTDFKKTLNEEEGIRAALKNLSPGAYLVPHCIEPEEFKKPESQQKFIDGPVAYITVQEKGLPKMGHRLLKIFIFYLFIGGLCAYLVRHFAPPDASYLQIFQLTGTVAWAAHGLAYVQESIWFARPWSTTAKNIFDALIYALITGGVFGWLV
ncbi:MAG: hypothetical protein QNJ19_14320 [Woeseiaceae bacterium]|nr:hypothetical protein [Woeseiaceae bacterium]